MKEKILDLLQTRMTNCIKEQFWAVGTVVAFNAVIVLRNEFQLAERFSTALIVMISIANSLGIYFVLSRHMAYYRFRKEMSKILEEVEDVPELFKSIDKPFKIKHLWGSLFYLSWIIFVWFIVIVKLTGL